MKSFFWNTSQIYREKTVLESSFVKMPIYACNAVKKRMSFLVLFNELCKIFQDILLTTNKWLLLDLQGFLTLGVLHIVYTHIFLKYWHPHPLVGTRTILRILLSLRTYISCVYFLFFLSVYQIWKSANKFFYSYALDPGHPRSLVRKHTPYSEPLPRAYLLCE